VRRRIPYDAASELRRLLEAEQVQARVRLYIDQHGWDIASDEEHWRRYQRTRMAEEYREDDW
jgi:dienelactone hydrolase